MRQAGALCGAGGLHVIANRRDLEDPNEIVHFRFLSAKVCSFLRMRLSFRETLENISSFLVL